MTPRSLSRKRLAITLVMLALSLGALSISTGMALAQTTSCGDIIAPSTFFNIQSDNLQVQSIEDCSDPFSLTTDPVSPFTLEINGEQVADGSTVYVEGGKLSEYKIKGTGFYNSKVTFLFRHEGSDYVYHNLEAPEPVEADYRDFAADYFPTTEEAERYLTILFASFETTDLDEYLYDAEYNDLIDENTGQTMSDRYYDFSDAAFRFLYAPLPLGIGTYTVVIKDIKVISTAKADKHILEILKDLLIPTVYAQEYNSYEYRYALTFTVAEAQEEPIGASSVLFLPGIQASRLYKEGLLGTEDQLWEPNIDSDVGALAMNSAGQSLDRIYTRDVIDEVNVTPLFQTNIYKGFLSTLDKLVDDEIIKEFEAFAYDWRFGVEDIVKNGTQYEYELRSVLDKVKEMAADSYTGKVTIVGHSNGGLLAKALINELRNQGQASLVEKIVFIGTPHLGTPKALATILHGYDQQKLGGTIVDDSTARDIMNNMPGAYGLLPSESYLDLFGSSIISFDDSISTQQQTSYFGAEIENITEYKNFLNGIDGRSNDSYNISAPYKTNSQILSRALDSHSDLDSWQAPAGIQVFNLVGTGLKTINSILYREVVERKNCTGNIFGQITCPEPERFVRPYAKFTAYGDETVTALSAESVAGETYYFDLETYRASNIFTARREHADFTEIDKVQDFVTSIIASSTVPDSISFISTTKAANDKEYEITTIDSPVRVVKEDGEGNQTGVIVQNGSQVVVIDIPGSDYFEIAGTKYVIAPKEVGVTTTLYGEAFGSYTMTVATLRNGDEQSIETELIDATTTPTMVANYEFTAEGYTNIRTDYNGDSLMDMETTLEGEIIVEESEVTLETLRAQIIALNLKKSKVTPLLVLVRLIEQAEKLKAKPIIIKHIQDKLLRQLSDTIKLYMKKGWISERDSLSIQTSIQILI